MCDVDDFADSGGEDPADGIYSPGAIEPVSVDQLLEKISLATVELIKLGDDPSAPMGSKDAHFPTRSEAVWRVACELARAGCSADIIAGILVNPAYGISQSVLEKRRPNEYALRQAKQALSVVNSTWPDVTKDGRPRSTMRNAMLALQILELRFARDLFRHRKTVEGALIQEYQGNLSDDACSALRLMIIDQFGFDVGKECDPRRCRDSRDQQFISSDPQLSRWPSVGWFASLGWLDIHLSWSREDAAQLCGRPHRADRSSSTSSLPGRQV